MNFIRTYWIWILIFVAGCAATSLFFIFLQNSVQVESKIRAGEVITWVLWISLYIGSPFILKSYIDDEREVKKMVNEEINSVIKQAEVINSKLKNNINKPIDNITKDDINIAFDILGGNIESLDKMIRLCLKDWNKDSMENKYLRFKSSVSGDITVPDFIINNDFYNRQYVEFIKFQDCLKEAKINVMRK